MKTALEKEERDETDSRPTQILNAALTLFAAKGYEATPVSEIAADCQLAVGGLYRHFKSKEEIANAVYRRAKTRLMEMSFDQSGEPGSIREGFARLWGALHRFSREHTDEFIFLELHNRSAYLNAKNQTLEDESRQSLCDFIRQGQEAGAIRPMEPGLAVALAEGVYIATFKEEQAGRLTDVEAAYQEAEEAAWRMIGTT